jgi:hypothetical protein
VRIREAKDIVGNKRERQRDSGTRVSVTPNMKRKAWCLAIFSCLSLALHSQWPKFSYFLDCALFISPLLSFLSSANGPIGE